MGLNSLKSEKTIWRITYELAFCTPPWYRTEKDPRNRTSKIFLGVTWCSIGSPKKLKNKKSCSQFWRYRMFVCYFSYIQFIVKLKPGCNWNSTQYYNISKTVSTIFCFKVFLESHGTYKSPLTTSQVSDFVYTCMSYLRGVDIHSKQFLAVERLFMAVLVNSLTNFHPFVLLWTLSRLGLRLVLWWWS